MDATEQQLPKFGIVGVLKPYCTTRSDLTALASVLQEGRGNANIDAGLRFIWRNLSLHMPYVVRRL
jgi:hypothetical protein